MKGMPQLTWSMKWDNAKVLGQYGSHWRTKVNYQIEPIVAHWNIILNVLCAGTCTGNEGSIEECHEPGLWEHYDACKHTEDVVLSCTVSGLKLSVRQNSCIVLQRIKDWKAKFRTVWSLLDWKQTEAWEQWRIIIPSRWQNLFSFSLKLLMINFLQSRLHLLADRGAMWTLEETFQDSWERQS